ncbi:hypothetical protein [Agreia sp. COWG]|uniref:hypothetical protein n=1 Tax=Agreia sp. COWG TaxID=2773266 RepID=UPI0019286191|nr:hypothetical protein [Agreia sp. COWG]CAD6008835.1 protein of unknown function [Agreia sp. COWG]
MATADTNHEPENTRNVEIPENATSDGGLADSMRSIRGVGESRTGVDADDTINPVSPTTPQHDSGDVDS